MTKEQFIQMLIESGMSPEQAIEEWRKYVASNPQGTYQVPDRSAGGFGTMSSQMTPDPQGSLDLMRSHDFANESTPYRDVAQWQAEQDSVSANNRRAIEAALAGLLRPNSPSSRDQWEFGGRTFDVPSADAGMLPESRWPQIQQLMQNLQALDVLDSNKQKLEGGELALEAARTDPSRLTKVDARGGVTLSDPSKLSIAEMKDATARESIRSKERIASKRDAVLRDMAQLNGDIRNAEHRLQLAKHYREQAMMQTDPAAKQELEERAVYLETLSEGAQPESPSAPPAQQSSGISKYRKAAGLE